MEGKNICRINGKDYEFDLHMPDNTSIAGFETFFKGVKREDVICLGVGKIIKVQNKKPKFFIPGIFYSLKSKEKELKND